ncbi:MAG: 2Fe-2S iron-sulfur cluster-binding protein [Telluria sp.]|nr:2Fe-2S iron-sulfur cluster-binding protein [Telluria sp.]
MTPWMRTIHKWIGLVIGIQFVLWLCGGIAMSFLDTDKVHGKQFRIKPAAAPQWPAAALPVDTVLANSAGAVQTIETGWLLDQPIYRLADDKGSWMVKAIDGKAVTVDAGMALQLAKASYSGSAPAAAPQLFNYTMEARAHKGQVWRVDFADAEETAVYLSAVTGKVLEHRNNSWRLFDFFWMLHIMDYAERINFNNLLLVSCAIGGLWLALSGVWLLINGFRLSEFIPRRWRRAGRLQVYSDGGDKLRTMSAPAGDTVFLALARNALQLPSNCGGGQSCGLCEVRVLGKAPAPTSADRAHLSAQKLESGYRLACALPVDGDLEIEVANAAALTTEYEATVTSVKAVAPFLREITIRPHQKLGQECRPGAYIQVHIPDYAREASHIVMPDHHREDWSGLDLPRQLLNHEPIRRSYSLALPTAQADGQLTLLVRFLPGPQQQPPGKGASYLYMLREGDALRFSGPFGDFAIQPGAREKVFIGGGAGMAPLRAMIHALLEGGAREPVHFWYGARSLRDAPYVEEMAALAAKHANFRWQLVLSDEQHDAAGVMSGLVHEAARDALLSKHAGLHACDFYLCGPPAMLAATRQLLEDLEVSAERVAFDDFKV